MKLSPAEAAWCLVVGAMVGYLLAAKGHARLTSWLAERRFRRHAQQSLPTHPEVPRGYRDNA